MSSLYVTSFLHHGLLDLEGNSERIGLRDNE